MNSYFVCTNQYSNLEIERFHICLWEFKNQSCLIEFGGEITSSSLNKSDKVSIELYIPWLDSSHELLDFYENLKDPENSRFIFNDSISSTTYLRTDSSSGGVIHKFSERPSLCLIPVNLENESYSKRVQIKLDLQEYHKEREDPPNIYFRFAIKPNRPFLSIRRNGIGRSSIIYDFKINEKRNIHKDLISELTRKNFCDIKTCFCFNIVPNNFELTFFESEYLKNVRTLEYESFSNYLKDKRIKENELIVVFNKKKGLNSYSFFSIFQKELVGTGQFALALMANLLCGLILFIPSFRKSFNPELSLSQVYRHLPVEIYLVIIIWILTIIYFLWGWINLRSKKIFVR